MQVSPHALPFVHVLQHFTVVTNEGEVSTGVELKLVSAKHKVIAHPKMSFFIKVGVYFTEFTTPNS